MKNKYNRNSVIYTLVVAVAIIIYLVIHLYYGNLDKDIYLCNVGRTGNNNIYTVKTGDSLEDIAKMYNISIEKLREANNLINNELAPGQQIIIPTDDNGGTSTQPVNNIIAIDRKDEITSLSFSQEKINIKKGDTLKLIVQVNPAELSSTKFTWESSDPSVISVDENGNIKGLKEGTAIITVTSPNGKTASVKVTVVPDEVKAKKIVLNPSSLTLSVGSSKQISATIEPENATNRELVWESSNPSVATVDGNGVVKGISPGTTTITVKTKDGTVVSKVTVTIKPLEVESLKFAQENINIKKGDTSKLIVEVKPAELSSSNFTWTSSDPSIVSVDENGNIKGLKEGTATITVTSPNGKSATINVTVVPDEIKVEQIILSPSTLSLDVGSSKQISATIEPENATNRELVWESSNPSVATVDENGVVKGISPGTTTITVKTKDGTVVSQVTVTVKPVVTPTPTPTVDDIVFEYEYDEGNYIYLINQFPIRDEVGKNLQGEKHTQDFKLRLNANASGVRYTITAEKLDGSDLKEEWTKLFLVNDGNDVQNCYRPTGRIKTFNEYTKYNGNDKEVVLYEGVITNSEALRGYKDFTYRMWVSEDLQLNNSNYLSETKTFKTRINVYAIKD